MARYRRCPFEALALLMVLAVATTVLGAVPDFADAQSAGAGHFSDDDGSVHEPAFDALASQGVLAGIECGDGLIGRGHTYESPILTVGESVTVRGYTITVIADDGDTHTVIISKTDDG